LHAPREGNFMRPIILALVTSILVAPAARADELRHFEDAALRAVQFVDKDEGWTVGDEGVIWHTINGGKTWERQASGVVASLRSIHFLNPYTGWVAGREELPNGSASVGILLFTQDGGLTWRRTTLNSFPGLNVVRFVNNKIGFVAGDGTDQFPTGMFATTDNGRTWKPVPGKRSPGWLAADFQDGENGALAGAWSRLGTLRHDQISAADVDYLGPRAMLGLKLAGRDAVAVGQGGLLLLSQQTAGARWTYADLPLPTPVRADWDFHAVQVVGDNIWVVGRPGSVVLHSANRGQNWQIFATGQPLPLHGLFFIDELRGWAVGELGTILTTENGGKNWKLQRRGGQRAAVLFIHSRPTGMQVDTVAVLGGQEGYLTVGLRANGSDPLSAAPGRASEGLRFAAAVRMAGGTAGEMLWQFPVPQHLATAEGNDLLKSWDQLHAERSAEELLRQLVLALRIWRPEVVVTDSPDAKKAGWPVESLLVEAVREAFVRAADSKAFPEQIQTLGLEPWKAGKLYGRWPSAAGAEVVLDMNEPSPRLGASPRDFAAPAAALLTDAPAALPSQRYFYLLESRLEGAAKHHDLMQGVLLGPGGTARREMRDFADADPDLLKALRARRNLQALSEASAANLVGPSQLLAQVGPLLETLPPDQAPAAAFAVASHYARLGQWQIARELFLLMVDRYPTHPLAVNAYRWLIHHNSSSEARRRVELGQFLVLVNTDYQFSATTSASVPSVGVQKGEAIRRGDVDAKQEGVVGTLSNRTEFRQWHQGCLEMGKRLADIGPLFASDPSVQFCLQASRRTLGDLETARQWYTEFHRDAAEGPWREAAAAELWLLNRTGLPPKPVARCRQTAIRPFLDGNFDDPCWDGLKPIVLKNAVGDTSKDYPTEAWLAYDKDFLYLALRCRHPADRYVPPVKARPHDADLRPYDRVSLMLDLDRDYATYFNFEVDQRGCVCEDCFVGWPDRTWNPRWFVAVSSEPTVWQIEAAIPLVELTGDRVTLGHAWACNIVRTLPGRGVQAMSVPADVQPRPEGMGLLLFVEDPRGQKSEVRNQKSEVGSRN
jgi:photosystem II stability/assembly factor-like uncharacterized protein